MMSTNGRNLQQQQVDDNLFHDGNASNFLDPCLPLPDDPSSEGWLSMSPNDDSSTLVTLLFDFEFYGTLYPRGSTVWINNNGNLNFGPSGLSTFTASGFPLTGTPMIAPFWADVDTRVTGHAVWNKVWYKMTNTSLSVVWHGVGYFSRQTDKRNTFQVVLSPTLLQDDGGNVCFCYADMDWTTGGASGGAGGFGGSPATVGVNRGTANDFVQLGRFDRPGNDYDGGGGLSDGVDYLDNRLGGNDAFCINVRAVNVPPVLTGFPNGTLVVGCDDDDVVGGGHDHVSRALTFASPELDQSVNVTLPSNLPDGMTLTTSGSSSTMIVDLEWTPQAGQAGLYELEFVATDNDGATTSQTLRIEVLACQDPPKCTLLEGYDKDACPNGPYCTPWRSPESCPLDESFGTLVGLRNQHATQDPDLVESLGFWFHYLNDKAAGYKLTVSEGFRAPQVYCCSHGTLQDCLPLTPSGFVVRSASHHSTNGVFVLPNGFGGVELLRGVTMTLSDVETALGQLQPTKILVEEFVGSADGSLPVEFKFHMFDGEIGSVTVVQNRGTECACFAEIDENWNRLDTHGCFVPGGKQESSDGLCSAVDFALGAADPHPWKDLHNCQNVDRLDDCVWQDLKDIARSLSRTISVYVRIDMFVGANKEVYVQEYTTNHNNGRGHCAAKEDPSGCVDSCFLGRLWKQSGDLAVMGSMEYGGLPVPVPEELRNWTRRDAMEQCDATTLATSLNTTTFISKCAI